MSKGEMGGYSQRVHTTYNRIRSDTVTIGLAQAQLVTTSMESYEVMLIAGLDNTATVWIGDNTDGCHTPLGPGASVIWPINNVNKIFARADAIGQLLHWSAGVPSV